MRDIFTKKQCRNFMTEILCQNLGLSQQLKREPGKLSVCLFGKDPDAFPVGKIRNRPWFDIRFYGVVLFARFNTRTAGCAAFRNRCDAPHGPICAVSPSMAWWQQITRS